ncbi:MAG: hypothetical protein GTN38_02250 [Candidatus Aenigmarchaeota archaeon]|nr:hypothetical protein [Candidatus Aenigmarchaeota archaeon]NIP40375.1 hypothetical protein [Candidatus Aenigmarchaeota archaeon]NIQ18301.1 hypothetical protein [Candidatus Aenigmarchaeota archaeon]NIS73253.1 hypothetical protein [Candidatus Aenigmarchaeota archaeon]
MTSEREKKPLPPGEVDFTDLYFKMEEIGKAEGRYEGDLTKLDFTENKIKEILISQGIEDTTEAIEYAVEGGKLLKMRDGDRTIYKATDTGVVIDLNLSQEG